MTVLKFNPKPLFRKKSSQNATIAHCAIGVLWYSAPIACCV